MRESVVWLAKSVLAGLLTEAIDGYPNETGGILVGYWGSSDQQPVITGMIGPGPDAVHKRFDFVPDSHFHQHELERVYFESGKISAYLGDWHVHPDGSTRMSTKDKRTLKRIARHKPARATKPLMLILGGDLENPELSIYILEGGSSFWHRQKFAKARTQFFSDRIAT